MGGVRPAFVLAVVALVGAVVVSEDMTTQWEQEVVKLREELNALNEVNSEESEEEILLLLAKQRELDRAKLLLTNKLGRTII